ncbi:putative rad21/Rec8-like protein [Medicago truncatula]|uniref:Putative rad21/Rec8-like protein n=1 Tax=Medicago truncatula TaxID=3880 RepID=A0A396ILG9_MEDTR|nr:putative rad21/Rec8-like protein [Medicago truncatula]
MGFECFLFFVFSDHILKVSVPVSLRLSAILLFGVVRIYSKKVDNVLSDCNNIQKRLLKVYPVIILPKNTMAMGDSKVAARNAITLPENFQLDELDLDFETG